MVDLFKKEPFDFAPGEKWSYSNSGYYLLGMIIQKVSGMPYGEYMQEAIFGPLGLRSTSYCDNRPILPDRAQGYEVEKGQVVNDAQISMNTPGAAGAICSSVLDLPGLAAGVQRGPGGEPGVPAADDHGREAQQRVGNPLRLWPGRGDLEGHRMISHSGGINGFITQLDYCPTTTSRSPCSATPGGRHPRGSPATSPG